MTLVSQIMEMSIVMFYHSTFFPISWLMFVSILSEHHAFDNHLDWMKECSLFKTNEGMDRLAH